MYINEKWRGQTWLGTGACTLIKSGEVIPGLVMVHVLELKADRLDLAGYWYMYFNEKWRGQTWLGNGTCTLMKSGEVRPGLVLVHVL